MKEWIKLIRITISYTGVILKCTDNFHELQKDINTNRKMSQGDE